MEKSKIEDHGLILLRRIGNTTEIWKPGGLKETLINTSDGVFIIKGQYDSDGNLMSAILEYRSSKLP